MHILQERCYDSRKYSSNSFLAGICSRFYKVEMLSNTKKRYGYLSTCMPVHYNITIHNALKGLTLLKIEMYSFQ